MHGRVIAISNAPRTPITEYEMDTVYDVWELDKLGIDYINSIVGEEEINEDIEYFVYYLRNTFPNLFNYNVTKKVLTSGEDINIPISDLEELDCFQYPIYYKQVEEPEGQFLWLSEFIDLFVNDQDEPQNFYINTVFDFHF